MTNHKEVAPAFHSGSNAVAILAARQAAAVEVAKKAIYTPMHAQPKS